MNICKDLELDKKAKVDLFLLAQSGLVGRTLANYLLWNLCSYWALDPTYEDLSHKVSAEVGWLRRTFDRPPAAHPDLRWWTWSAYEKPWDKYWRWSPMQVPREPVEFRMGPGGEPMKPPECWQ